MVGGDKREDSLKHCFVMHIFLLIPFKSVLLHSGPSPVNVDPAAETNPSGELDFFFSSSREGRRF